MAGRDRVVVAHIPWLKGTAAHDFVLALALPSALLDVRHDLEMTDDEHLNLIASGDLTASGAEQEFHVAHAFLRSHWQMSRLRKIGSVGLDLSSATIGSVAGNHDTSSATSCVQPFRLPWSLPAQSV